MNDPKQPSWPLPPASPFREPSAIPEEVGTSGTPVLSPGQIAAGAGTGRGANEGAGRVEQLSPPPAPAWDAEGQSSDPAWSPRHRPMDQMTQEGHQVHHQGHQGSPSSGPQPAGTHPNAGPYAGSNPAAPSGSPGPNAAAGAASYPPPHGAPPYAAPPRPEAYGPPPGPPPQYSGYPAPDPRYAPGPGPGPMPGPGSAAMMPYQHHPPAMPYSPGPYAGPHQPPYAVHNTLVQNHYHQGGQLVRVAQRNRWIALLWAFFLGPFGAHRFYLGKVGTGATMLIMSSSLALFPITFLWVMVDVINLLAKSDQQFDLEYNCRLVG